MYWYQGIGGKADYAYTPVEHGGAAPGNRRKRGAKGWSRVVETDTAVVQARRRHDPRARARIVAYG